MNGAQPDETAGDYSYDLSHEDVPRSEHGHPAPTEAAAPAPAEPAAEEPDEAGDYSYDLAHEFRRTDG